MGAMGIPFNINILNPTKEMLASLKPVRVGDIFDGNTNNFHEDGLFSVSIFGRSGDDIRKRKFSYIDVKINVFHPLIYSSLVRLKSLYEGIMSGQEYAVWNEATSDFDRSTVLDGKTGFHFFTEHWHKINFLGTGSDIRDQMISLIEKYKDVSMVNKILVMPAGIRDIEIKESGRPEEPEVNGLYRKLIAISSIITEASVKVNPEILDNARYSIQRTFNEIFDLFEAMINGKKKLVMDKWASRRVFGSTRNVASAMDLSVNELGHPGNVGFNSTVVGLYQTTKALGPVTKFLIKSNIISKIFISKDHPVRLVNKNTLKLEETLLKSEIYDMWTSDAGIDRILNKYSNQEIRHKPIEIDGKYLALIYKGPDNTFKIFSSIDELPPDRSLDDVHPITFTEFLYLSIYKEANEYPIFITRYPVTGIGSIYPSYLHLKPTNLTEARVELDHEWKPNPENTAYEFPTHSSFVNTLVPHPAHNARLNLDYDGDTLSGTVVLAQESKEEVRQFLKTKRAYVGTDGRFICSMDIDTIGFIMHNLTGD